MPKAAEFEEVRIIGHYGIGIANKCRHHDYVARDHLGRALRLARKTDDERWMTAALIALASVPNSESQLEPDPKRLAKLAAAEEKRANWNVAAELWEAAIGPLTRATLVEAAQDAFSSAERCLKQAGSEPPDMIELYLKRYSWCRQTGLHSGALNALEAAERLAARHKLAGEQARAIDEQGVCYHWLGQSGKAVAFVQKAVSVARRHRLQAQLQRSLNNLGEALRVHGSLQKAVDAFSESEDLCRASGDAEGAIVTALNRVLALEEMPSMPQAAALLKRCCREAKKGEHWREYARALESLGNFAWRQGRLTLARTHYSEALGVARRHDLQECVPEIAVNYASLLQALGQAGRGLRLLERFEGRFSQQREPYIYFDVLADLLVKTGHTERAKRCLQSGKDSAAVLNSPKHVAFCAAHLAALYEEEHRYDLAEQELEIALRHESEPDGRVKLLAQRLRVEHLAGTPGKAARTFEEARVMCESHQLIERAIDIHMVYAVFEWRQATRDSKVEALKAYMAAMALTLAQESVEAVADVQLHILVNLSNSEYAVSVADFDAMLEEAATILPPEAAAGTQVRWLIMWPFAILRVALPFVADRRSFSAEVKRAIKRVRPTGLAIGVD